MDRDSRGRFVKGSIIWKKSPETKPKVVSICKRCGEVGISAKNKSGLCQKCSTELYFKGRFILKRGTNNGLIKSS